MKPKVQVSGWHLNEIADELVRLVVEQNDPPVLFSHADALSLLDDDALGLCGGGEHSFEVTAGPWPSWTKRSPQAACADRRGRSRTLTADPACPQAPWRERAKRQHHFESWPRISPEGTVDVWMLT